MTDNVAPAEMTEAECKFCGETYNPNDIAVRDYHTMSADCEGCGRCRTKPRCYECQGMFCYCASH